MIASLLSLTMILLAILLPMGLHIVHLSSVRVHRLRTYMMDPCMLLNSLNVPSLILIFGCKLILCGRKRINNTPMVCTVLPPSYMITWIRIYTFVWIVFCYSIGCQKYRRINANCRAPSLLSASWRENQEAWRHNTCQYPYSYNIVLHML